MKPAKLSLSSGAGAAAPSLRLSTALMRATSSRGLNGLGK
jgi:hypothetical protein